MSDVVKDAESEVVAAVAGGEAGTEDAGGDPTDGGAGGAAQEALFTDGAYTWDYGDGQTLEITNRGQLSDVMKHSVLRNSDLEAERRSFGEQKELMTSEVEKAKKLIEQAEGLQKKYGTWDERMLANPNLEQAVRDLVMGHSSSKPGNSDLLSAAMQSPEVKGILSRLEKMEARAEKTDSAEAGREFERAQETAAAALLEEFSDFDRSKVQAELQKLRDAPQQDLQRLLMRTAYHSLLGQERAGKLEARRAQEPRGGRPSVSSTPGTITPSAVSTDGMSEQEIDDATIEALKRLPADAE